MFDSWKKITGILAAERGREKSDQEQFRREYLSDVPKPSDGFKRAYQAWMAFFDRKEEFDQKHCQKRTPSGIAIPVGLDEMRLTNQNARLLRQELLEPLKALKIPQDVENSARDLALREHESKWMKKYQQENGRVPSKTKS